MNEIEKKPTTVSYGRFFSLHYEVVHFMSSAKGLYEYVSRRRITYTIG